MSVAPVWVRCMGLVCPLGLTPESSGAALRAGLSAFDDLPMVDALGEPVTGACVWGVSPDLTGRERLAHLLAMAFDDALGRLPDGVDGGQLPWVLCTREADRPGASLSGLVRDVERSLGRTLQREGSAHLGRGAVGVFEALRQARAWFGQGGASHVLVAAADSLVDARTLGWLARSGRLKGEGAPDGVIPGEAAAVLLVSRTPASPGRGLRVRGLGFGQEPATVSNDLPLKADGLTAAIRDATAEAGVAMRDVDFRLSDVAGESYAFEELVLAQTRTMQQTRETQDLWHPASGVGDCGAAAGAVQLAWAEQAFARGYAAGPVALAQAAATPGARAAAVLTA